MTKKFAVLFVDDERRVLNSLKRALLNEDFRAYYAISGLEALEILDSEEIQVVVSDMKMPEMNGLELLQLVAERHPEIVRIVLSGYSHTSTVIAAVNEGKIFRYITKPWNVDKDIKPALVEAFALFEKQQRERDQARKLEHDNLQLKHKIDNGRRQIDQTKKVASEIYLRKTGAQQRSLDRVAQFLLNFSGIADGLEEGRLEDRDRQLVAMIKNHCRQALAGIERVKLLYALEMGERRPRPESFVLADFCRELEARVKHRAGELGVTVVFQMTNELPEKIVSDRELMAVMLGEIMDNALAACTSGAIIVCNVKTESANSLDYVCFSVRDTGPGMDLGQLKDLQQAFVCGDERRKDPVWGVGLALARLIAARLRGALRFVDNRQGCQVDVLVEVGNGRSQS